MSLWPIEKELKTSYMRDVSAYVKKRRQETNVFPASSDVLNAFKYTPFPPKLVITCGFPYNHAGTDGLAYSVRSPYIEEPELFKILSTAGEKYENIENNLIYWFLSDLRWWAEQGVLLLNQVMTTEQGNRFAHKDIGWFRFTDYILKLCAQNGSAFFLWGKYGRDRRKMVIDNGAKFVIMDYLPAHQDFPKNPFQFTEVNNYLSSINKEPIIWTL